MTILTRTVKAPEAVEEANRRAQVIVGDKATVVNRLKTAAPMQVMLQVKIAEVSRDLMKEIGVNLVSSITNGFDFVQGRAFFDETPTEGAPNRTRTMRGAGATA